MSFVILIPVYLSLLLLAAHFLRAGWIPAVALALLSPFILIVKRKWAARTIQIILMLASVEWIRTLLAIMAQRRAAGEPWQRMAAILGGVALFTACSALLFLCRPLKARFKLGRQPEDSAEEMRNNL
jgi:hypothetical protein